MPSATGVDVDPGTVIEIETGTVHRQVQSEADTLEGLDLTVTARPVHRVRAPSPATRCRDALDIRPNEQGAAMCIPNGDS